MGAGELVVERERGGMGVESVFWLKERAGRRLG